MRKLLPGLFFVALLYCLPVFSLAQESKELQKAAPQTRKPDVAVLSQTGDPALDKAISDLCDVISGPAGQKRDWVRFKEMFAANAQMGVTFTSKNGEASYKHLTPDEYIASSGRYIEENGFFETEISRKTERFGNLVHVWSTYEAREKRTDAKPLMRGINSIQFVKIADRYKVASLIWQQESAAQPLPAVYLPGQN